MNAVVASPTPPAPALRLATTTVVWTAATAVLTCILFILTRACDYDLETVLRYAAYFGLHVAVPGCVVMAAVNRSPLSFTTAIALGLPTGFAIEIFTFLGCAAIGAKSLVPWLPVGWLMLALLWSRTHAAPIIRVRMTSRHAGLALALSVLFLATTIAAASNMFVESPLADGIPQRPIFHDWVYLVSRAAAIKQHWPLEDPSLAGTPLQYHYFMLVHAASASFVTGAEVTLVLLRLMIIPLGAIVVVQVYSLGRRVAATPWGGVLAAFFVVATGELAFVADPQHSVYVGRFIRWLYVSPTFYFGLIFFGAVVLAVARCAALPRLRISHVAWLCLLGAGAAGAKGTVMPVVLVALAGWAACVWWRQKRFPTSVAMAGVCFAATFATVYFATMAGLRSGTAVAPFDVLQVSDFWQQNFPRCEAWCTRVFSARIGAWFATLGCAVVVFAGTEGVRLLALPWVLGATAARRRPVSAWVTATFLASAGLGLLLSMDADSELYVFLMSRVPASILAAACALAAMRRFQRWRAEAKGADGPRHSRFTLAGRASRWIAIGAVSLAAVAQLAVWLGRNRDGFREWIRVAPTAPGDDDLQRLEEALLWIRSHTENDAVLIANLCTAANLRRDNWSAADHTLAGVHYYYSALSERRMLVEGPLYLLDPARVQRRTEAASNVFYARQVPNLPVLRTAPCYLIVDRTVQDPRPIALVPARRVFANRRVEVYQLPRASNGLAAN